MCIFIKLNSLELSYIIIYFILLLHRKKMILLHIIESQSKN